MCTYRCVHLFLFVIVCCILCDPSPFHDHSVSSPLTATNHPHHPCHTHRFIYGLIGKPDVMIWVPNGLGCLLAVSQLCLYFLFHPVPLRDRIQKGLQDLDMDMFGGFTSGLGVGSGERAGSSTNRESGSTRGKLSNREAAGEGEEAGVGGEMGVGKAMGDDGGYGRGTSTNTSGRDNNSTSYSSSANNNDRNSNRHSNKNSTINNNSNSSHKGLSIDCYPDSPVVQYSDEGDDRDDNRSTGVVSPMWVPH